MTSDSNPNPKYRIVEVNDDNLAATEQAINELNEVGYELSAVSKTFMLLVLPGPDPMHDALAQIQQLAQQRANMELPPEGSEFDPLAGNGGIEYP